MGPCGYAFFLIVLLAPDTLGYMEIIVEDKEADKYIAKEDVDKFLDQLRIFGEEYGQTWMMIPNGDGEADIALLQSQKSDPNQKRTLKIYTPDDMPELVKLFLHTKKLPEGRQLDLQNLENSDFDPLKPTKIILHGWMASSNSSVVTGIRDAYLEKQNVNVISVDWSSIAQDLFFLNPVRATPSVGMYLGFIIDSLVSQKKAHYNKFHLVGHSLGAHVSSFAGSSTKQKIGRITGLDPALPGFQFKGPINRLDASDAKFVDVIHTCAGILGVSAPVGHIDFYPNGGSPYQPGCQTRKMPLVVQSCSHGRSHEFFAESIRHFDFRAVGCVDWEHFKRNKCYKSYAKMGEYASPKARGPFYLKTGNTAPYALGFNGTFF